MKIRLNKPFLEFIWSDSSSPKQRAVLLRNISLSQTLAISEIVTNILQGIVQVESVLKSKLSKKKALLRAVAENTKSVKKRAKIIKAHPQLFLHILLETKDKVLPFMKKKQISLT